MAYELTASDINEIDNNYYGERPKGQVPIADDQINNIFNNIPGPLNFTTGLMSLGFNKDPIKAKIMADLPQAMMGRSPSGLENLEHSLGKNAPSLFMPELKGESFIANALSRILGQTGFGGATGGKEGAMEQGGIQALMEGVGGAFRPFGWIAEKINPIKYAGKKAEEIRNLAQSGHKEAEKHYKPVHEKYDENWVTAKPKEYLGFHPEDTQYFKPDVNRAYRDFLSEPSFKNLHELQSKMGKYPDLYPLREGVKDKTRSYLLAQNDLPMLESYKTGSDIMRDKYYPFVSNDTLANIVEHEIPIKTYDPKKLNKALQETEIVTKSQKGHETYPSPLIDLAKDMQNKVQMGQAWQYGLPMAAGAIGGHFIDPTLGALGGTAAGSLFGKYIEPSLLNMAQNPALLDLIKNIEKTFQGAGREAVGYSRYK